MSEPVNVEDDPEIQTQLVLLAASKHDLPALRALLRNVPATVQDAESGISPLHAAIAACEEHVSPADRQQNGHTHGIVDGKGEISAAEEDLAAAAKTVKLLLQNGAIWNDVDKNDETPGCLALRLGLKEIYEIMVDAGVRAEMLLNRLDEYEALGDDEETEEEEQDEGEPPHDAAEVATAGSGNLVNAKVGTGVDTSGDELRNEDYLQASLRFQDGRILDDAGNGVMMAWETGIMRRTADLLCPSPGLRVLNVGHGLGIIDTLFQAKRPIAHHIVEAHPAVVERMKSDGWLGKANVTVHEGRWQDVVPKILEQGTLFDSIYFDTFAEDYKAFRDFFSDCLVGLLDDTGKWGFFNGMGADRQICYDVYTKVVEMDLFEAGFDTEWETIPVEEMENCEWEGVKRRYWTLREYKLPTCKFIG